MSTEINQMRKEEKLCPICLLKYYKNLKKFSNQAGHGGNSFNSSPWKQRQAYLVNLRPAWFTA